MKKIIRYFLLIINNLYFAFSLFLINLFLGVLYKFNSISVIPYFLFAIDSLYIIFSSKKLYLLFAFVPMSSLFNMNFILKINLLNIFSCEYIFVYFINAAKKRFKFSKEKLFLLIPFAYTIFARLISILFGGIIFKQVDISLSNEIRDIVYIFLPILIILFDCDISIKSKNLFNYFVYTFLIQTVVAFLLFKFYPTILNSNNSILYLSNNRFKGFDWDQNHYSIYAIFFFLYYIRYFSFSKKDILFTFLPIMVCQFFAILSGSKMYLICFAIMIIILLCKLRRCRTEYFKISLAVLGWILLIAIPIFAAFNDKIITLLSARAINYSGGNSLLDNITSGRTIIFANYSDYIMKNQFIFWFGINNGIYLIDGNAIHCTLLYLIYFNGFPNAILLLNSYYKIIGKKLLGCSKIENIFIVLCFLLPILSLNLYLTINYFLLFVLLMNFTNDKETKIYEISC